MALNPKVTYPTQTTAVTAARPLGGAQDVTVSGDGTGTPWTALVLNDIWGFLHGILVAAGITPTGTADTADASQYLTGVTSLSGYANVKVFGATGDGVTDDTTAVQAAIDSVAAGGGILVPVGTFMCDKLSIGSNKTILGVGGTLKLNASTNDSLLVTPVATSNVVVRNVRFDGNSASNVGTAAGVGLIAVGSSNASPSSNIRIEGCVIDDAYRNGIALADDAFGIKIIDNKITNISQEDGMMLSPSAGNTSDVFVSGNTVDTTGGVGIAADGELSNSRIVNNFIDNTTGSSIQAYHEDNKGLHVKGNECQNSGSNGVHIAGTRCSVVDNDIFEYTTNGAFIEATGTAPLAISEGCKVTGNTISSTLTSVNAVNVVNALGGVVGNNTLEASHVASGRAVIVEQRTTANASNRVAVSNNTADGFVGGGVQHTGNTFDGTISGNNLVGVSLTARAIEFDGVSGGNTSQRIITTGNVCSGWDVAFFEGGARNSVVVGNGFQTAGVINTTATVTNAASTSVFASNKT